MVGAVLCCAFSGVAHAQEKRAFVIGNDPEGAGVPQQDAIGISQRLLALGFDVSRRENVTSETFNMTRQRAATIVLYYSGPVSVSAQGGLMLADWSLQNVIDVWRAGGADTVSVFVQGCYAEDASIGHDLSLLRAPQGGVFAAVSTAPEDSCSEAKSGRFTDRLTVALALTDADFSEALETVGISRTVGVPVGLASQNRPLRRLPKTVERSLDRLEPAVQAELKDRIAGQNVVVGVGASMSGTTHPVSRAGGTVISRSALQPTASGGVTIMQPHRTATTRVVQIIDARLGRTAALPAALPQAVGLPRPLIRVGRIKATDAAFDPLDQSDVLSGDAIDPSSYEARQQLRARDPDQFTKLLATGAFDPAEAVLVVQLQRELQRMNCYAGGIDGDWGRGSRAAVARYRSAAKAQGGADAATVALFRELALNDGVRCPVVARVATPRATQQRTTTIPTPRRQRAATPAPAATPKPVTSGTLNGINLGTGIIR